MLYLGIKIWSFKESVFVAPMEVPESTVYSVFGEMCVDRKGLSISYRMIDPVVLHKWNSSNDE